MRMQERASFCRPNHNPAPLIREPTVKGSSPVNVNQGEPGRLPPNVSGVFIPNVTLEEVYVAVDLAMALWRTRPEYLGPDDARQLLKVKEALDGLGKGEAHGTELR